MNKKKKLACARKVFDEEIEKTLYYYPVSMETNQENGNNEIVADAIFIADNVEKKCYRSC